MQSELDTELPGEVQLLGVDGIGMESTSALMTENRTPPWLQDVTTSSVWTLWAVEYRDVVIVDAQGIKRDVFNLTTNDLADPANRATLKQKLMGAR